MTLGKIETRTQEVIFLTTTLMASSLILGALFYIYLAPEKFQVLTGNMGGKALKEISDQLGLAIFALAWGVFSWGKYTITMFPTFVDVRQAFVRIILNFVSKVYVAILVATYLVIGSKSLIVRRVRIFL